MDKSSSHKMVLPHVLKMDPSERELYLSQIGSFTQEQRHIFNLICDYYEPCLDYNRFILHANKNIMFADNQIENLMKKIQMAHQGLLKYSFVDGVLRPSFIVLADPDSFDFYYHILEDGISRALAEPPFNPVIQETLALQNLRIPLEYLTLLNVQAIGQGNLEGKKMIFQVNLSNGEGLLFSSGNLKEFIALNLKKIRYALSSPNFLASISRLMNVKLADIQSRQKSFDPLFWMGLCGQMIDNKEDLLTRLRTLEPSLFSAAEVGYHYFKNQISAQEKEKELQRKMQEQVKELCEFVASKDDFLLSSEALGKLVEPIDKKYPGFKDLFYQNALVVKGNTGLPILFLLKDQYIHRDHLYPYFRAELSRLSKTYKLIYLEKMQKMLRTNNRSQDTTFYTRENFKLVLKDHLDKDEPYFSYLLEKPRILSESIVHYFKTLKKVKDLNRIKDFMNNFFKEGMIRYKDLDHLLNIYLLDLFNEAYLYLPWWKKFILRLSGKKESYLNRFSGGGLNTPTIQKESHSDKKGSSSVKNISQRRASSTRRERDPKSSHFVKKNSNPNYNLRQREKAWQDFEDIFSKK